MHFFREGLFPRSKERLIKSLNFEIIMKVKFIRDKEYDGFMIWQMLKSDDPSGAKNRAKLMRISEEQLKKIYGTKSFDEVKEFINELVEEGYRKYKEKISQLQIKSPNDK
jgi:hypothetical protein